MSEIVPINFAQLQRQQAAREAKKIIARQVASEDRFTESTEEAFNPAAASRMQERFQKFRPLNARRKLAGEATRVEKVEKKSDTGSDLAQNYQQRNSELDANILRKLASKLKDATSAEEVLESVLDVVEDPTLADEVLEYLEQEIEGNAKEMISDARNYLNSVKKREIVAGRNIDPAAKSFYKKGVGTSPTELRNLYREITQEPKDHNALFTQLSKKYPYEELKAVISFLLKGMSYDLKSKGSSIQPQELMRLMTETRNLQSILWVYLFFKKRKKMIRRQYDEHGCEDEEPPEFEELAQDFISIVEERYPSVARLLANASKKNLSDEEKIVIFMQYRDAIRGLAPRLYRNLKHRQDLLLIIIEVLDELEYEEEEEE